MHIKVYDKTGALLSEHDFSGTLTEFIKSEAGDSYNENVRPYSATKDGAFLPYKDHDSISSGNVEVTIEPLGDPISIIIGIISIATAIYSYQAIKNIPDYSNPEKPNSIYKNNVRANVARPNQVIREVSGTIPIYPDFITNPRRRYENSEQFIYNFLSVGQGYFSLSSSNVYIAGTPISNYSGDIDIDIFEPGDTVSTNLAHENWHTARDIANLALKTEGSQETTGWGAVFDYNSVDTSTIQWYFNGDAVRYPYGADSIIVITSAAESGNERYYKIQSISTTDATDDTTTVVIVTPEEVITGYDVVSYENDVGITTTSTPIKDTVYTETPESVTTDLLADITWTAVVGGVNREGPFILCPPGETTTEVEIDVRFPRGLGELKSNGGFNNRTVAIEADYRDSAVGGNWTILTGTSWTNNTNDELGYTISATLPSAINPEVRFRRVTPDSTDSSIIDTVEIERVKVKLETPTSYSDVTTLALKVRSTRALSRNAENKISILGAQRKLPTIAETQAFVESGTSYDLSTSTTQVESFYDLSNAQFIFANSDIYLNDGGDYGEMFFINSGARLCIVVAFGAGKVIFSYGLGSNYDITSLDLSDVQNSYDAGFALSSNVYYCQIFDSGNKLLGVSTNSDETYAYTLNTPYDVTTINSATPAETFNPTLVATNGIWAQVADGKLFRYDQSANLIQYSLGSNNNIDSAVEDSTTVYESLPSGVAPFQFLLREDKLYLNNISSLSPLINTVYEFDITDYDISGATASGVSFALQENEKYSQFDTLGNLLTLHVSSTEGEEEIRVYDTYSLVDTRATSSIAEFLAYMMADRVGSDIANYIDWTELTTFDTTVEARGDGLNGEFGEETTVWEALKLMLGPGYAEPTTKDGKLIPVREVATASYTHLYTPDIMIGSGVLSVVRHDSVEEPDGIIAEYLDSNTGLMETVDAFITGDAGVRAKKLRAFGMVNETRAWRYAIRERLRERYKPIEYRFSTELDALNSYYGDTIGIVDELNAPQFGKVLSVSGSVVITDQNLEFSSADIAFFRDDEGTCYGPFMVSGSSDSNEIHLDSPTSLGFTPGDYDVYFSLGTESEVIKKAIVRSIQPSADKICDVVAEEYIEEIYANDDLSP